MKKHIYFLVFFLHSALLFSQQNFGVLDVNNIQCNVSSTGDLFNRFDQTDLPGFQVPATLETSTIYAANLWIGGYDAQSQLRLAAELYQSEGQDYYCGPLSADGTASTSDETMSQYNQVWVANSFDVAQHQLYFNLVSTGQSTLEAFPNGYVIPKWFNNWPAHGNTLDGQDYYLAPFNDFDGDGVYGPENGDSPLFCGDKCVLFIFNDKGGVHTESQGQPIGVQVMGMLYGYEAYNSDLDHTVFVHYTIINQSTVTINDCKVGMFCDFDLGNPLDDYVQTDVSRGCVFAKNGDNTDEDVSGITGYGDDLPMQGVVFLRGPRADEDLTDNPLTTDVQQAAAEYGIVYPALGRGYGDQIVDNETLGMVHSMAITASSSSVNGAPTTPLHFDNYLSGVWKNGSPLTYGGDGTADGTATVQYIYPGDSDPLFAGTAGVSQTPWDETIASNTPGDRAMVLSSGAFTFEPGDIHELDFAFVFARESDASSSLEETFLNRVDAVRALFEENDGACISTNIIAGIENLELESALEAFPNPFSQALQVSIPKELEGGTLTIRNDHGQLVRQQNVRSGLQQLDVDDQPNGIYFITVRSKQSQRSVTVLKQ